MIFFFIFMTFILESSHFYGLKDKDWNSDLAN